MAPKLLYTSDQPQLIQSVIFLLEEEGFHCYSRLAGQVQEPAENQLDSLGVLRYVRGSCDKTTPLLIVISAGS
jgi:hypothetical protein